MHALKLFDPGTPPDDPRPSIQTTIDLFLAYQQSRADLGTIAATTIARQREKLEAFADTHGRRLVSECRNSELIQWINDHKEWVSPHTKVTAMAHVVTCFRWAYDEGHIEQCPFSRRSKQWPRLEPRAAISPPEYARIMLLTRDRRPKTSEGSRYKRRARFYCKTLLAFRFAMLFLWDTGARVGEMKKIRWRHIDLATGIATLTDHKTRQATGHRRHIALSKPLRRMIRWLHNRLQPSADAHVFTNGRGTQWKSSFAKQFRRYADLAGVRSEVTAYSLRHGFVVRALDRGEGQRQIADVIGHTTTRYVEWYGRSARQNFAYLQSIIDRINGGDK